MTSPVLALRAAIGARCAADSGLAELLGGAGRIFDEPPRGAAPPYAAFGEAETRDWSTSSDRGHEHDLRIVVWAAPGSTAGAVAAAERLAGLLDESDLTLSGHRLVSLAVTEQAVDRDPDTNVGRVTVRLRATTEVAA